MDRVLSNGRSGRDFLQTFQMFWGRAVQVGPSFETLASARPLSMVAECSARLRRRVDALRPSPLAPFAALAAFDRHAGDGHYLEHATHDPMPEQTHWPTGHFFALNLKSQSLFPLVPADLAQRKKEQDLRALKRQSVVLLRQGAGQGRKGAVGLGQGRSGLSLLAGTHGLGDIFPVPAQSGDVFGRGEGAGH